MRCQCGSYTNPAGTATTADIGASVPDSLDSTVLILSGAPERIPQEIGRTVLPHLIGEEGTEPTENYLQTAELTLDNTGKSAPIYLSPGEQKTLRVSLVNGGGCSLPVNIVVKGGIAFEDLGGGS